MSTGVATADYEKGTLSNSISTGDSGSATAWDGTNTPPIYDNTHAAHGSKAAKYAAATSSRSWWTPGTPPTEMYGRAYAWLTANTTTGTQGFLFGDTSTSVQLLNINANGKAVAGASVATNAVSLNQWIRMEFHGIASTSVGFLEIKLFNSADSITPTETITSAANLNTGASYGRFTVGPFSTSFSASAFWLDQIVVNASAYPGPFPVSTTAPTVSGSTPVGSTLSCDGGTWNNGGTFTLTYQWTRDGSNIGSATSSSYTTVSADSGHAIGCTVTATGVQATNESASQASSNTITATSSSSSSSGADPSKTASAITVLGL